MVNSGKNNSDSDMDENISDEITDVLLMEQDEVLKSTTEKLGEVIYELVAEDEIDDDEIETLSDNATNEKIKQLQNSQETMRQQLEQTIATSDKLNRQLKKEMRSKRTSTTAYVGLAIGGLALITATAVALFAGNLQRDIDNLTNSVSALENNKSSNLNGTLDTESVNARIDELTTQFNQILAEQGDMGEVLQATNVLKAEIQELANKNFSPSTPAPKTIPSKATASDNEKKSTQKPPASEKSNSSKKTDKAVVIKNESANTQQKPVKKAESVVNKAETTSKPQKTSSTESSTQQITKHDKDGNLIKKTTIIENIRNQTTTSNNTPISDNKDWVVGLGSYKDAAVANQKASEYRRAGVPAMVVEVHVKGQTWNRISTKPFDSKQKAEAYAKDVKAKLNIKSTLVTKSQ